MLIFANQPAKMLYFVSMPQSTNCLNNQKQIMTKVTLYTKATCPYCIRAKHLLDNKGVAYTEIDVYDMTSQERAEVATKTNNYRTVPQIFIGETFIGGFDQLNELNQTGKLDTMLAS